MRERERQEKLKERKEKQEQKEIEAKEKRLLKKEKLAAKNKQEELKAEQKASKKSNSSPENNYEKVAKSTFFNEAELMALGLDNLLEQCALFVVQRQQVTIDMIKAKFFLGENRANRILNSLVDFRILKNTEGEFKVNCENVETLHIKFEIFLDEN